nr:putative reverse transcriptase domain-containing protein [Tanacetum cinerariifolium]
ITCSGMTPEAIKELVNRRVEEALAAYKATRAANALEAESQSQNGSAGDNRNGDNGNGRNGNGDNGNGINGNIKENDRGARPVARECTYRDFIKCQPLNFKGTKGVVGLIRWFEKTETVFHISNCPEKYQVNTLLDIIFDTLDVSYAIELADERISETNTELRGCTLGLSSHPFNIDLMPVELGSFDVVIGMDWLANHHAMIVCDEKIVRISYGDEVLIIQGNRNGKVKKSKLSIISCTKTQKHIKKGCSIFLALVMRKGTEGKSEEKRLEDVPTVREFLEVFLEDFPGLPPVL